jgi:hypothetical protein
MKTAPSARAADLLETRREHIVIEANALLDAHLPVLRAVDAADRAHTASTICVALEHYIRGAPLDIFFDVLRGLAEKRLADGLTVHDLLLVPLVYAAAVRRGLGPHATDDVLRSVEEAILRVDPLWIRMLLEVIGPSGEIAWAASVARGNASRATTVATRASTGEWDDTARPASSREAKR